MAEQEHVVIKIETQTDLKGIEVATKELKNLQTEIKKTEKVTLESRDSFISMGAKLAAGWTLVTKSVGLALSAGKHFISFIGESIQAHLESARAVKTLEASYQALGLTGPQALKNAKAFASEMQAATGIADETFLNAQRMLATFGVVGQKAQESIRAAYALSVGRNMEFASALDLVTRAAVAWQTQTLAGQGIQIADK